jgi:hypothetical protein
MRPVYKRDVFVAHKTKYILENRKTVNFAVAFKYELLVFVLVYDALYFILYVVPGHPPQLFPYPLDTCIWATMKKPR